MYGNSKSVNSKDYAQKPQQNCTFMNSTSEEKDVRGNRMSLVRQKDCREVHRKKTQKLKKSEEI